MACKQGLVPIAETLADRAGPEKALWGFYSPMRLRYPPHREAFPTEPLIVPKMFCNSFQRHHLTPRHGRSRPR